MTKVSSAWAIRPFRLFWGAGALSRLGAEIGEIALPALTLITLGATALEASWVRTATVAPFLLFTLWFGVIVDRRRRQPLMIAADLVRGAVLVAVCALALFGLLTIPILILAALTVGTMTVLYQLADFSFLPQLVPEDRLVDANAKITATDSAILTAGVGAGGLLVQALTAPIAVAMNALGYFASALLISRLRVSEPRITNSTKRSALGEAKAGLSVLVRQPILRSLAAEATIWNFGNEIFMLALAVHVLAGMPAGPVILGAIVTCGGVGAFLGSMLSARMTARFGYGHSLLANLALGNSAPLIGVLVAIFAPAALIPSLCIAFFISGIGIGVANSQSTAIRQIAVVPELRGRVNAGYRLASWGALSIGAILGGLLVGVLGTMLAAVAGAILMTLATVPVALSPVPRVRAIEDVQPERARPEER